MSAKRIAFPLIIAALAFSAAGAAPAETLHTRLNYLHRNAIHHDYGHRGSVHRGDIYVSKTTRSYRGGVVKDPGASNRYFSDTRDGQPEYTEGSTFITRGFDLLPDARPPF